MRGDTFSFISLPEHPCSYREGQSSRMTLLFNRNQKGESKLIDRETNFHLMREHGFFHNQNMPFLFTCKDCNSCVPLRINTARIKPSKSREKRQNKFLDRFEPHFITPEDVTDEHFKLFANYLVDRHPKSGMNEMSREQFLDEAFKFSHGFEMRDTENADKPVSYAWIDILGNEANGGYMVYNTSPDAEESLGTKTLHAMIDELKEKGVQFIYCGAWIKDNPKMGYKENLPGLETFISGGWVRFDPELHTQRTDALDILSELTDKELDMKFD